MPHMANLLPLPPEPLVRAIRENRAAAIVGSGVSCSAGAPSWAELLTGIAAYAEDTQRHKRDVIAAACEAICKGELISAAGFLEEALGPTNFRQAVCDWLGRVHAFRIHDAIQQGGPRSHAHLQDLVERPESGKAAIACSTEMKLRPSVVHRLLVLIGFKHLLTTNYDSLLEECHVSARPAVRDWSTMDAAIIQSGAPFILKLHGSVDRPSSMVLTDADYGRAYQQLEPYLQSILANYQALWIGVGHRDPDLRETLEKLRFKVKLDGGTAIAYSDDPDMLGLAKRLSTYGITQVLLDNFDRLRQFLRSLAEAVNARLLLPVVLAMKWTNAVDAERLGNEVVTILRKLGYEVSLWRVEEGSVRLWLEASTSTVQTLNREISARADLRRRCRDLHITHIDGIELNTFDSVSAGAAVPPAAAPAPPSSERSEPTTRPLPSEERQAHVRTGKLAESPTTWPTSVSLEDLVHEIVERARAQVDADAASIFVWDDDAGLYVLRDSTKLTPFIRRTFLDHTREEKPGCGITTRCVINGRSYLSRSVLNDPWWSANLEPRDVRKNEHCELARDEIGSVIVVPLWNGEKLLGVVRVVRRIDKAPFESEHLKDLEGMADGYAPILAEVSSFAHLMNVGLTLSVQEMCKRAVQVLKQLVSAKGCSIFLLESEGPDAMHSRYRCVASTGLQVVHGPVYVGSNRIDAREAFYELPGDYHQGHLTAYVLAMKRNVVIDDLGTYDFQRELGITRQRGGGKFSEVFHERPLMGSDPFMAAPLFFHERFDPSFPALGVVRAARQVGAPAFAPSEQRRFFAFVDQLGKAILRTRYHDLLTRLSLTPLDGPLENLLRDIVREVPRLLGGKGCSIFLGTEKLEMRATHGELEGRFKKNQIKPYNLNSPVGRGLTGAAAVEKRSIVYNSSYERDVLKKEGIVDSGRREYEIQEQPHGPPGRLAAVPIMAQDRAIGVLRIPKTSIQSPFTRDDIAMLERIGRHVGAVVYNMRTQRQPR